MNLTITKVTVIQGHGADLICLQTNQPSPVPGVTDEPLSFSFQAERDKGVDYVVHTLGVDLSLVDVIHRPQHNLSFRSRYA